MQAVITGDVINSQKEESKRWINALEKAVGEDFKNPKKWELFRGDEFQYFIENDEDAFSVAVKIKSKVKEIKGLDVRMSIGIGHRDAETDKVSVSTGSAFVNSGRNFETLKKDKINLIINSGNVTFDEDLNLICKWALQTMDNWSAADAETVYEILCNPTITQEQLAVKLNISQSSVSQRFTRANIDLVLKTDAYYRKKVAEI